MLLIIVIPTEVLPYYFRPCCAAL